MSKVKFFYNLNFFQLIFSQLYGKYKNGDLTMIKKMTIILEENLIDELRRSSGNP